MASNQIPSSVERRRMCQEGSADLASASQAYLEAGRWGEALECIAAAGDMENAALLAAQALEAGDLFYYTQAQKVMGREPAESDLAELKGNAARYGKQAFALTAEKSTVHEDTEQ